MPVQFDPYASYETGYPDKHLVMTGDAFQGMLNFLECSPVVTFDFETSGLEWYRDSEACGLALGGWDGAGNIQNFYVPYRHRTGERQLDINIIGDGFKTLLADERRMKVAHNLVFDEHFARKEGWQVYGMRYDTMVGARLFDENRPIGLKYRAKTDLQRDDADVWEGRVNQTVLKLARSNNMGVKVYKKQYGFSQVGIPLLGTYACFDVEFTTRLLWLYEQCRLSASCPRIWQTEMALTRVICDMEEMGMPIDVDYLENLRDSLSGVKKSLELEISHRLGGKMVNLGSDEALRNFLINGLGLRLTKLTKGKQFSVDRDVLESFLDRHPVMQPILDWRDANKLETTYTNSILERLDRSNILHPSYQQVGTVASRLSCKNPNFQNQPTDDDDRAQKFSGKALEHGGVDPWSIRRAYVNRGKGWVRLYFDYSQIELRILAWYSRDPVMMETYLHGGDIHERTSLEVFGSKEKRWRRPAKVINFGLAYCLTDLGFARQAKIPLGDAERHMKKFFTRYAGIMSFRRDFWNEVRRNGSQFRNHFGRQRRVPAITAPEPWVRQRAERQAIAALIQGQAGELTKESMVRIHGFFQQEKLPAYPVANVHDEIQVDCHVDAIQSVVPGVKALMENYPEFQPIPIIVDADYTVESWANKRRVPA